MTSLYQLSADYQRLINQDELGDNELALLDQLHTTIEDRVIHYAMAINELKGKFAATKEAVKIAQDKARRLDNNILRIEKYVLETLINNGIEKIDKHPAFDITIRLNPVAVDDYDPQQIPMEYWVKKEVLSLDKKRVKEDIENLGLVIPGAKLTRNVSLRIG